MTKIISIVLFALLLITPPLCFASDAAPNDHRALGGLNTAKVVFDVNISSPDTMILYLNVVQKTIASLKAQRVTPDVILAFRGAAVSVMSKNSELNNDQEENQLIQRVQELKKAGAYLESCNIAAEIYAVDSADIFPGIVLVGNTFASLTGYQNKGYAMIPLY
jgi:intracellular sulfur oxidation DsrE/DsrF family protein